MSIAARFGVLAAVVFCLAACAGAARGGAGPSSGGNPESTVAARNSSDDGSAEDREFLDRGRDLYRVYCINCHGESGRGDGPVSRSLKVTPTDLTELSLAAGGEFPFDRVFRTIDGRERVPTGHGETAMPFWGLSFQQFDQVTDQENEVQARILELTGYLRSLQRSRN